MQPEGLWRDLDPYDPSPTIIKLDLLEGRARGSVRLQAAGDPMPARLIQDEVLEMWGWSSCNPPPWALSKIVPSRSRDRAERVCARARRDFHTNSYIFLYMASSIHYKAGPQAY